MEVDNGWGGIHGGRALKVMTNLFICFPPGRGHQAINKKRKERGKRGHQGLSTAREKRSTGEGEKGEGEDD